MPTRTTDQIGLEVRLADEEWNIAQRACTPAQLEALTYWRRGFGYKRIALALKIPRDAARGRIDRALANIDRALEDAAA